MKMNHLPKTVMNDSALQLAVLAVLQFRDIEYRKFLQNCKDCRLQIAFRFAEIKQTET